MNRIDQFFKKRLDVKSSDKDDWNIPSDDLWNAALPHFPKEEKKRRSFLWLWLSLGLLFSVGVTYYFNDKNEVINGSQQQSVVKESNETNRKETIINEGGNNQLNVIADVKETELSRNKEKANSSSSHIEKPSFKVTEEKLSFQKAKSVFNTNTESEDGNTFSFAEEDLNDTQLGNSANAENESFGLETLGRNITLDDVLGGSKEIADIVNSEQKIEEHNMNNDERKILSTKYVKGLKMATLSMPISDKLLGPNTSFIKPKAIVQPKKELGISSQYFLLHMFEGVNLDTSATGTAVFQGRFINLNLKFAYWIGRKWSISTGINYGDISLNLNLDTDFLYDENDFEQDISSEFNLVLKSNNSSNGSGSPVVLKPGVELETGDVVRLRGQVDLGLRAIQVPFILNYHWYNKRFEFYTGLGFALETIWGREENFDFNLFDNNILLTDPSTQSDLAEHYFDFSFHTRFGTKFNFSERLNFDFAINILPDDLDFSGLEFGLYYRWHK